MPGERTPRLVRIGVLSTCLVVFGCDTRGPVEEEAPESGARRLDLSGSLLRLGSDDPQAAPDEAPGWTRFGHEFRIDATEMTQGEYLALVGANPSSVQGWNLPVTNVSWYDAVLAANSRSHRDGLDTVYDYVSVQRDPSGGAWGLPGLVVHLERGGWRLPTEAEWEAAAKAGSSEPWSWGGVEDSARAESQAWYAANSGGAPHEVATRAPNAWGFHDMAGNVMEWVNDWKASFPSDTIVDFAGPEAPGDVAEAPLKGGAYCYGIAQMRPSNRSATYAAYRSSKAEYVGFRLARGGFRARYTSSSGGVLEAPAVSLTRTDVSGLVGSWQARLVFVNRANGKGTLTWVDYGESNPVARSLPDRDPVFHPAISPDGRWVAWSTVLEGSPGTGHVKVRRLAKDDTTVIDLGEGAIPRWWTDGTDTFLVRTSSAVDDLSPLWKSSGTTARRWSGGGLSGESIVWSSSGGFHDGRSGSFLFTGYRRLLRRDMVGGGTRTLFTAPDNGKRDGDTSQVCNVSAAPDASGRSMFLDFGYAGVSGVVGRPYGIHEVAFVADSTGRILRTIASPEGEAQWEHLEWSNHPDWAVSGAIDATGAYRNLYLLDLLSGNATRIASGQELWQPALWIQDMSDLPAGALDSAAQYDIPQAAIGLESFAGKALNFWRDPASLEAVVVGSSRSLFGVNTNLLGMPAFNFGIVSGDFFTDDRILRDYVLPHCPRLRVVVLGLTPGLLWRATTGSTWDQIAPSRGYRYDAAHAFWTPAPPAWFEDAVRSKLAGMRIATDTSGNQSAPTQGWGTDVTAFAGYPEGPENKYFQPNWDLMKKLVSDLDAAGLQTIMVNFPVNPLYAQTPYYELYGPTRGTFATFADSLRALEARFPGFHFYDANADGKHDYTDAMAMNRDHLSGPGRDLLSRRLDTLIRSLPARRAASASAR